jgi:hypothetical protein
MDIELAPYRGQTFVVRGQSVGGIMHKVGQALPRGKNLQGKAMANLQYGAALKGAA